MLPQMPARPLGIGRIRPADQTKASQSTPQVREVNLSVDVVVREMSRARSVRSHVDDRERVVGQGVDIGTRPGLGGHPGRAREDLDQRRH
jgi:hypothetical protein